MSGVKPVVGGRQTRKGTKPVWLLFLFIPLALGVSAFVALTRTAPIPLHSGTWVRTDRYTVALTGNIDHDSLFRFKRVFDDRVWTAVLNSGGGLAHEALQIGMILKEAGVDVVVDGVCLSSCANYLFTAGRNKTIRNGVVGFHGNVRALTAQGGSQAATQNLLRTMGRAERAAYRAELEQTVAWERRFFADLGIDQALFERTQRPDKGKDGETYAFLLPTPATFRRYGVRNVKGVQSLRVKRAVEKHISLPILLD